jgi:hypothetical protein
VSSPSFPLLGATSHPTDVATLSRRVTLLSHGAKMSSLHLLHLPTTLYPIASPSRAETEALNLHHLHWPTSSDSPTFTHHCYKKVISILVTLSITQPHPPFLLLPSQSTMPMELHLSSSFSFTVIPRSSSLCITTHTMMN